MPTDNTPKTRDEWHEQRQREHEEKMRKQHPDQHLYRTPDDHADPGIPLPEDEFGY